MFTCKIVQLVRFRNKLNWNLNNCLLNKNHNFLRKRAFSSSIEEALPKDVEEQSYKEVEDEFEEYVRELREFSVMERSRESGNLTSFLSRLSVKNSEEYLQRHKGINLQDLKSLEKYSNALYTFVTCGLYANPDHIKSIFQQVYKHYKELLTNHKLEFGGDKETQNLSEREEVSSTERVSAVLGSVILSCCELGIFKDNPKKVEEVLDSFLFGGLSEKFLLLSSGKLINSVLFAYSVNEFFGKDYNERMETVFEDVISHISKKEHSMDISDIFYLKLSIKFLMNQNPSLAKKLSKESMSFLTNVVFQEHIREKEPHVLEDIVPAKIKEVDPNIEGGMYNIGPFTFTHVSLQNRNVYLANKPESYFNSNLKLGRREYLNWMESFLKISGWNPVYLFLLSPPKSPRNIFFPWQNVCVHRTGAFLERNRLALRVPINLTKFEIREYLRKLYDSKVIKVNTLIKIPKIKRDFTSRVPRYYRNGPMYKKAIVTLEHAVPDEVKMIGMDFELGKNPAITKKNVHYGKKTDLSYMKERKNYPYIGEYKEAWKLPIPNLLAEDDWEINPELRVNEDELRMKPDPKEPHTHGGAYTFNRKPEEVPEQQNYTIDLTPWRRKWNKIKQSEEKEEPEDQEAKPTPWNFPKAH